MLQFTPLPPTLLPAPAAPPAACSPTAAIAVARRHSVTAPPFRANRSPARSTVPRGCVFALRWPSFFGLIEVVA
jgi:hypothetical protein